MAGCLAQGHRAEGDGLCSSGTKHLFQDKLSSRWLMVSPQGYLCLQIPFLCDTLIASVTVQSEPQVFSFLLSGTLNILSNHLWL